MHRVTRFAAPIFIGAAALSTALPAQSAPNNALVINEVDTRGPAGGNDEFIELHNNTPVALDLSDWALRRCNSADTTQTSQIDLTDAAGVVVGTGRFPAGTSIAAGGFLVIGNTSASGYSGPKDFEYKFGITDHTGVQLVAPSPAGDVVVDAIGFSGTPATNACVEGVPAENTGSNDGISSSRINAQGALCHAVDSDVNRVNFGLLGRTPGSCNIATVDPAQVPGTAAVKLSEVDTSGLGTGLGSGNDEFIELHNNGPVAVDLTGWTLWRCNSANTALISEIVLSGSLGSISAFGTTYVHHTLWTTPGGAPAPAATYSVGVSEGTGVRLHNSDGVLVDSVGFSGDEATNACVEGVPATAPATNTNDAAARTAAGGVAVDTGVNAVDFTVVARTPGV